MSKYGRFFEKNAEGKYFCKNCLKVFTAQKDGGTSHLRQHLKAFHRDVFHTLVAEETAKKQLTMAKLQQKRPLETNYQILWPENEAKRHRPMDDNWSAHDLFANESEDSLNWSFDQTFAGLSEQIAGPSGLPAGPGFNVDVTAGPPLNELDIFNRVKREEPDQLEHEQPEIIHAHSSESPKRRIMIRGRMSNIIAVNCHEQPIERVIVYNDRAEVKRAVITELTAGDNVVHITNVPQSLVHDSVRVDGKGDCVIHEVRTKTLPALVSETDSPKVAAIRARLEAKKIEVHKLQDRVSILEKRIEALDKVVVNLGTGILPKDGQLDIGGGVLENISKFYGFYDTQSTAIRQELRDTQSVLQRAQEEQNKIQNELHNTEYEQNSRTHRVFAIALESQAGGKVQLEVTYQVFQANWIPSYDFRVDTTGETPSIQVSYFGEINQTTGEDWTDVPLILSTLQPSLGGDIPDLGTMEVSIYHPPTPPPAPCPTVMAYGGGMNAYGAAPRMARMAKCADVVLETVEMERAVCGVQAHALSTEFNIAKKTTVPSSNESTKVTVGIFELHPQLVHECVPSKNRSVFMTASAVNTSSYPLVPGQAAVYVNNSFVTNTYQKSVFPNERFSCSLGVDTAVRVDYRPVKKYGEQTGMINKSSSIITEQIINVRNTKPTPVLLLVKEHIPRSTDEKIKIKILHPSPIGNIDSEKTVSDVAAHPKEGHVLNLKNNLEWTVKLAGGAVQDLILKYAVDHPKDEKLEFAEKY